MDAAMYQHSNGSMDGRVALVTGGSSGIGAAVADLLMDRGCHVAVADLEPLATDTRSLGLVCDVTDPAAVDACVARVIRELGTCDILVCAAGAAGRSSRPWEVTDAEWNALLEVNASGTFFANRAVARHMIDAGRGRIVNISSIAGQRGQASLAPYAAAKAAVIALTQSFGVALAPHGVLVNCVLPGVVRTPLLDGLDQSTLDQMVSRMPLGRMGEPVEIARLVAFLASDELSFTTGACFDASAGRTLS